MGRAGWGLLGGEAQGESGRRSKGRQGKDKCEKRVNAGSTRQSAPGETTAYVIIPASSSVLAGNAVPQICCQFDSIIVHVFFFEFLRLRHSVQYFREFFASSQPPIQYRTRSSDGVLVPKSLPSGFRRTVQPSLRGRTLLGFPSAHHAS